MLGIQTMLKWIHRKEGKLLYKQWIKIHWSKNYYRMCMALQLRICTQRLRKSCPESVPPELWVFRGGREKGWSRSGTCMGKAMETRESTMWGQSVRSAGRLVLADRWKIQELDEKKKKSLQTTLEGLSFRGLSACNPLEDFNCASDKIRFVIQKAHSGSSSVGGKESGYPGDGQTQQKTMTIIQERENEDSGWRNRQIQRHFGKFAG